VTEKNEILFAAETINSMEALSRALHELTFSLRRDRLCGPKPRNILTPTERMVRELQLRLAAARESYWRAFSVAHKCECANLLTRVDGLRSVLFDLVSEIEHPLLPARQTPHGVYVKRLNRIKIGLARDSALAKRGART
jgi:hypothetical protein